MSVTVLFMTIKCFNIGMVVTDSGDGIVLKEFLQPDFCLHLHDSVHCGEIKREVKGKTEVSSCFLCSFNQHFV